ncbi:MAG: hypothetical protein AVDCRST_MAG25-2132 [uncultured Rubrobacteraceae bacterium]|uniref:Uncharacterized protein n=1 Tax=uncultured Rubrobacteraceae bacterium TaxID=349277 RepID=A0A6J4RF86_9ACTN|nr:MAG: hypothetical protein AVDCRST_MAG25-2132 [uncultured Rubrobacteraceae bacterium]
MLISSTVAGLAGSGASAVVVLNGARRAATLHGVVRAGRARSE